MQFYLSQYKKVDINISKIWRNKSPVTIKCFLLGCLLGRVYWDESEVHGHEMYTKENPLFVCTRG